MAYTQAIEGKKGTRWYRGFYLDANGRYKSAGTYGTRERALEVAHKAEKHAAEIVSGSAGGLDPVTRATRTIAEYKPIFLRHHRVEGNTKDTYADTLRLHVIPFLGKARLAETNRTVARNYFTALEEGGRSANTIRQAKVVLAAMFTMAVSEGYLDVNPFHDIPTPKVRGPRAIKIATTDQYLKVRACLPTKPARVFSTLLVSSGLRLCEATGLQSADFDFDTCIFDVTRSVVKMSREHHPRGKTFLVREYTKNGEWRRIKLDRPVAELVRAHIGEHGIELSDVIFPAELVAPPRATKPGLTEEEIKARGTPRRFGARLRARHAGRLRDGKVPVRRVPPVGTGVRPRADAPAPFSRLGTSEPPLGEVTRRGQALPGREDMEPDLDSGGQGQRHPVQAHRLPGSPHPRVMAEKARSCIRCNIPCPT
jgi:integrase